MTAVDTNIIIRLLTHDDEAQFQKARKIFSSRDIFIPNTVLMETEWVLRFAYRFEPTEIRMSFTRLLGLPNVHVNNPDLVYQAIQWHESGLDFADALHLATSQKHSSFLTFDNKFIRKAKGLSNCSVKRP